VLVRETATGTAVARFRHPGDARDVAIEAAGRRLTTVGDDATARVWQARTGELLARPSRRGDGGDVEPVERAFSPSECER
jgi:hypothetical protein